MPKYLFTASYTQAGAQGVAREGGTSRANAVSSAAESVGGRLEAFYFAFGDEDAFVIADLPDNTAAAALTLAVNAGGGANVRTTVLLSPSELDEASRRTVGYRAPGK